MSTESPRRCRLPSRSVVFGCTILCGVFLHSAVARAQDSPADAMEFPPLEEVDAATRSMWLIDGIVVDAESGRAVERFVVTPGSLSIDESGRSVVRWRDNLKRVMEGGRLRWPRTSGFSVMRFRVTAEGYRPAFTQRVWRGGPHIRIRVPLVPIKPQDSQPPRS